MEEKMKTSWVRYLTELNDKLILEYVLYLIFYLYQFKGIFIWSVFFGVIAKIDFILLFILFPAVLLPFVGVFVILLRTGVRFSIFRAFYDNYFFSLFCFGFYEPSDYLFLRFSVKFELKFSLSSGLLPFVLWIFVVSCISLCSNTCSQPILCDYSTSRHFVIKSFDKSEMSLEKVGFLWFIALINCI